MTTPAVPGADALARASEVAPVCGRCHGEGKWTHYREELGWAGEKLPCEPCKGHGRLNVTEIARALEGWAGERVRAANMAWWPVVDLLAHWESSPAATAKDRGEAAMDEVCVVAMKAWDATGLGPEGNPIATPAAPTVPAKLTCNIHDDCTTADDCAFALGAQADDHCRAKGCTECNVAEGKCAAEARLRGAPATPAASRGGEAPDCGDNSCRYATKKGGMRTNGGCRCDDCPTCGAAIRPGSPGTAQRGHRRSCTAKNWVPPHYSATTSQNGDPR